MPEIQTAISPVPTSAQALERALLWDLADGWHTHLDVLVSADEISDVTRATYKQGFDRFVRYVEHCPTVSENVILDWIADLRVQGAKPSSINTWLAGVRSMFKWAHAKAGLTFDPTQGVRGARRKNTTKRHRREVLTDAEMGMVLAAPPDTVIGKRDAAIIHLMAFTAARTVEIWRADLENLKTEQGRLVLYVHGKGHADADDLIVIANPGAQTSLYEWLAERGQVAGPLFTSFSARTRGDRLSRSYIRRLVKGYFKSVGVLGANKTTHSLRHTAATSAIRHGATVQQAQVMLRHANISTTMIYFHETDRVDHPAEDFIHYGEE